MAVSRPFRFKKFLVEQTEAAHPVGTDGVLLGAWTNLPPGGKILDVGTGTGLLALMMAQRMAAAGRQEFQIFGLEIHEPSARRAARNFVASPWAEQLEVVHASLQNFAQTADFQFDLIVSNPPFFSEKTVSPEPERQLARHVSSLPPVDLLDTAARLLAPAGLFSVILPAKGGQAFCEQAAARGLYFSKICRVRSRPEKAAERWLIEFRRRADVFENEEISIHDATGDFSEKFRALTEGFYL